jgi:C-terminal processing protease CtpA/Prc
MKALRYLIFAAAAVTAAASFVACGGDDDDFDIDDSGSGSSTSGSTEIVVSAVTKKVDQFAIDVLQNYYLWNEEIAQDISRLTPDTCTSPIAVVNDITYSENGVKVDRWTELMEDLSDMESSVQGNSTTFGFDFGLGTITNATGEYFLLVTYVFKDGPAAEAGIKRGDIILTYDGSAITASNVYDIFNKTAITLGVTGLTSDGNSIDSQNVTDVSLTAVTMYEDPILLTKTFDIDGEKVGYMVYNSFDLKSSVALADSCEALKNEGIDKLILDLRYNGGGYVFTEGVLGSLLAPWTNVSAGDVFQQNEYNAILTQAFKDEDYDTNEYFSTTHSLESDGVTYDVDVTDGNLNLSDLYVIVTGSTASASEGLIVGLQPYMNVHLYGEQTYGKFCSGFMLGPSDIYEKETYYSSFSDWGMYVMVGKFLNADGENAAYPSGIAVGTEVEDDPFDGCQLGDENETMLKAVLSDLGKTYSTTTSTRAASVRYTMKHIAHRPMGISISETHTLPSDSE